MELLLRPAIMRCYLTGWFLLALSFLLVSQTTIVLEAGPISYTNIKNQEFDSYTTTLNDCTSIRFSVDYEFSEVWDEDGSLSGPDFEANTACNFGLGCAGDPTTPELDDCSNCWDFMWMQFYVDGTEVEENLIGVPGNLSMNGTYESQIYCVEPGEDVTVDITNQNWAAHETNTFSNLVVYCWEGAPNFTVPNPVCGNLDLLGNTGDDSLIDTWDWTSDMGSIINDPAEQNTFTDNPLDGETFTLTVTDENACSASTSQMVVVSSFDAELLGGGITCPGNCTDPSSDISLSISGGTGPYTVNFTINGINIPFAPSLDIDEILRICIDEDIIIPTIDASQDPVIITIPAIDVDVEINNIVDATGCQGNIIGGSISIEVQDRPEAEEPVNPPTFCVSPTGQIDLTALDDMINGGNSSLDVFYYESEDLEDLIDPANAYDDFSNLTIYANTWDGFCYSEFVEINFNLDPQPTIEDVEDIIECVDSEDFQLPLPNNIADINPANPQIASGIGYYLDSDATDGPYISVPVSTTDMYMIWVPDGNSTCEPVVVPVSLQLTRNPILDAPLTDTLSGCGSVILPEPEGDFFNDHFYEGNNGMFYREDDEIFESDNVSRVTLTLEGDNGCFFEKEYVIDITSSIMYSVPSLFPICDSLILPPITPATPTVAYYTESRGQGSILMPGETLYAPFNSTLYLFDPNEDPACAQEVPFPITISSSPNITLPQDTFACDALTLPSFRGTFSDSAKYARAPLTSLDRLLPGEIIRTTEKIYILDTIGGCTFIDSINVSIIPEPYTGNNTEIFICDGYMSTNLNFVELIGNPDAGGIWSYADVPDFNPSDPESVDVSVLPIGSHDMTYAIEITGCPFTSSTLTITVSGRPFAGEDYMLSECGGSIYDFMDLVSDPEEGGFWSQIAGDPVDISDSTRVDMTTVPDGNYAFVYTIEGTTVPLCDGNAASLLIEKIPGPSAGDNNTTTACAGTEVNVRNLLSADADPSGTFFPDGFLLSGDIWNTTGSAPQTYQLEYVVESANPVLCPNDTAFITIELTEMLTAGTPAVTPSICEGQEVILEDLIDGESAGGRFVLSSDYTTPVVNPWIADAELAASYIIDGIGGCNSDTTSILLPLSPPATAQLSLAESSLCAYDKACVELEVTLSEQTGSVSIGIGTIAVDLVIDDFTQILTICADNNFGELSVTGDTLYFGTENNSYNIELVSINNTSCPNVNPQVDIDLEVVESPLEIITQTLCFGDSIEVAGRYYYESTIIDIPRAGQCDSIINIVIDNYSEAIGNVERVLCEGTSFDVFGTALTRDTVATFMELGGSFFGCDTILNLNLSFQDVAEGIYAETICDGSPRIIEGENFDINNPAGEIRLIGGSVAGCDTLIIVQLNYQNAITNNLTPSLCPGSQIEVNGVIYDESNPSGIEVLTGMGSNGCDSLVVVDLSFTAAIEENYSPSLCSGGSEIINGTVYDESNPSGQETFVTAAGCDSILNINLSFTQSINVDFVKTLCEGDSEIINGNVYDETNPMGVESLQSVNGCDSIINVTLSFNQNVMEDFNPRLCEGESETVNGTVYDISNPSGTETLQSLNGCDSIVNVNLSFTPNFEEDITTQLCQGDSRTVNGTVYDETNPSGQEIMMTTTGCDSIINVNLSFVSAITETRDDLLCGTGSIEVNGNTYNASNPTGVETLQSVNGCDSIITIDLSFVTPSATIVVEDACPEGMEGLIRITELEGFTLPVTLDIDGSNSVMVNSLPFEFALLVGSHSYFINDDFCVTQGSIDIFQSAPPNYDIISVDDGQGETVYELVTDITPLNIMWSSPNLALTCTACDQTAAPTIDDYSITVSFEDNNGCIYTRTIESSAPPVEQQTIYIPNILGQNDPSNSVFYIQSEQETLIDEMLVYDRWGNLMYENNAFLTNDPNEGWDATRNGKSIEQGVYLYTIKMQVDGKPEIYFGNITLIK